MRAKSARRLLAEQLRRDEGLSYNEIAAKTGISKSTLSNWLRDVQLTPEQEHRLQERLWANRAGFAARALPTNRERYAQAREAAWRAGAMVIEELPKARPVDELALAMLYLGEGSKSRHQVQLASMDVSIMRYFVCTLIQLYDVDVRRFSVRLNLVEAARPIESELKLWWSSSLGIALERFVRSQYDARNTSLVLTHDYHGVCTVGLGDTLLQQRLLGLAQAYLHDRIGNQTSNCNRSTAGGDASRAFWWAVQGSNL